MTSPAVATPSTPEATVASTRNDPEPTAAPPRPARTTPPEPDAGREGRDFLVGPGVARAVHGRSYQRRQDDPLYRPLWIYTLDPAASQLDGPTAVVNVPYEPLEPGPRGAVLEVDNRFSDTGTRYGPVDLDAPHVLLGSGRRPSPTDPLFHQQMVYAVGSTVCQAFQQALGRQIAWGFRRGGPGGGRLRLVPHAGGDPNAFYDPEAGEVCFGFYDASEAPVGRNLPRGQVFTCLSHDIVVHEVTHALLDGMRTHFTYPSGPDVLAFHEAFADLVAIFQHFSYREVVQAALRKARGRIAPDSVLAVLAGQFGQTTTGGQYLRTAIDTADGSGPALRYKPTLPPHELGSVLVSAVFDAFRTVFGRKTERYVRLATGGTGVLAVGELPADLLAVLGDEASKLASQFLRICIRAIDYCPPVALEFGEFLRAVITADFDLVPDDPLMYREAWIDAFARRGIYPPNVSTLSEDALRWRPPARPIAPIGGLSFAELQFSGDPAWPANADELRRQARALGAILPVNLDQFGLAKPHNDEAKGERIELPTVQSIRSSRRVGPDGQIVFDLVAEVTQRRIVRRDGGEFELYGGATVILGPKGEVRYVIAKNVLNPTRTEKQWEYMRSRGNSYWLVADGRWTPSRLPFKLVHERKDTPRAGMGSRGG